jgi:hypothetical protein
VVAVGRARLVRIVVPGAAAQHAGLIPVSPTGSSLPTHHRRWRQLRQRISRAPLRGAR